MTGQGLVVGLYLTLLLLYLDQLINVYFTANTELTQYKQHTLCKQSVGMPQPQQLTVGLYSAQNFPGFCSISNITQNLILV